MGTKSEDVYIGAPEAGRILGLCRQHVTYLLRSKVFRSAHQPGIARSKPGVGSGPRWRVLKQEVVWHKLQSHNRQTAE